MLSAPADQRKRDERANSKIRAFITANAGWDSGSGPIMEIREHEIAAAPKTNFGGVQVQFPLFEWDDSTTKAKETIMNRTVIRNIFTVSLTTVLAVALATTAQAGDKECSNATLTSTLAYTNTGFFTAAAAPPLQAGPFAGVGVETFDGNGGTTATTWVSINGNISQVTIKGTYSVNPDCTGTLTLFPSIVSPPITVPPRQVFFVIDDDGNEFRAINTTTGDVTATVARRQFSKNNRQ